jgi:hypothetical protein
MVRTGFNSRGRGNSIIRSTINTTTTETSIALHLPPAAEDHLLTTRLRRRDLLYTQHHLTIPSTCTITMDSRVSTS